MLVSLSFGSVSVFLPASLYFFLGGNSSFLMLSLDLEVGLSSSFLLVLLPFTDASRPLFGFDWCLCGSLGLVG